MHSYSDNKNYPKPKSMGSSSSMSDPSVQDDTRTKDVKAGELIIKDDKVSGEEAKMKAGYGQTKGLLYYKYIK
tara:strand:+ start:2350 stop:2568 length:219 start_codon:yes stop_codon:yes gene_type:complete